MEREDKTTGKVVGIVANLVMVEVDGPVAQNEICFIALGSENLMAEVIKITGKIAYVQVFESTRGLKTGSRVEFQGHMLEVSLAPGILSRNYDGLQNDLDKMDGIFLKRGDYTFKMHGTYKVKEIAEEGEYTVDHKIAVVENGDGTETTLTMVQKWPVKVAIGNYKEKLRPFKLLETGVRCMDTLNPITEGGTGFIPGPFGTGKTVLQHAISKQAEADIVIIAACGESASEVVES